MRTLEQHIGGFIDGYKDGSYTKDECVIFIKAAVIAHLPPKKEYPHNTIDFQGYAYNQALKDIINSYEATVPKT